MSKANARGSQLSAQHGRAGSSSDLGDGRDSPVSMSSRHSGDYKMAFSGRESRKENVMVVARFRPVNKLELTVPEKAGEEYSLLIDERQRIIGMRRVVTGKDKRGREESHNFVFDRVFGPQASQQQVFDEVARDVVTWTSEGYNTTIFAYGQTGSGKTYTMFGAENEPRLRGLIPRSVEQLFQEIADNPEIEEVTIKCSFLEIYKETIRDLLRGEKRKDDYANFQPNLRVRQSRDRGVYVQGLIEKYVYSPSDVLDLIKQGEGTRSVAMTRMNEASSRSHAVLTLLVSETWKDGTVRLGKLHLVDLAGSENVGKSQASGETLQETQKINKSLSALGNVIYALTDNTRDHVPYRDSKLTYLLQDSLGGNTKTVLIVTCSPHESNYSETLSTLKFAKRAKNIENIPSINKQESVKQLKAVVQAMEEQLQSQESQIQEMTSVLGALGVERDSGGQFQLPKDGSRVAKVDARETAQYKLQIVQLQKKLAKAEKQNEKMDRIRKREQAYYTELKDLFAKQRELAVGLAEKLRVRDDTIRQMTLELEEYEKFQATIEAAFAANPALLAAMGLAQPSMEQARMRRMSTKHLREKSRQMTLDANDFAGLAVEPGDSTAEALQEIDQLEPEHDPPSEAEFPSEPPSARDRNADPKRPKGIAVQPSLPTRVGADQKNASSESLTASERAAKEAQQATKGRVVSGVVTEGTAGAKGAAAEAASTGAAARVMTEIIPIDADLDAKTAATILANSAIFIKYPFSGGLLAKPTKKQMFYNADNDSVVYWDAGTKITNDSKAVPIGAITHLFVGKKTPAFQRSTAKRAKDPCCFSIQSGDRTLDLEAESEWERDQWVSALRVLCDRRRKPGDPPLQFVGSVPNDVLSRARGSSKNLQSLATQSSFTPLAPTPEAATATAPAPVKKAKKEAKVISDYSAEFEDGGAGGRRRGENKDPSALGGDLDDGDEAGAKKSGVGLEVGIGKRGDGVDGADAAARKKRLGNLPDYRFRDITDVDVGEPTREDLIREVRTVKEEQRKIKHKLAEYRYDPIVALPAGSSKSISDMAAEQERRVQEIRTVLRSMGLPTDGPHNAMASRIQTFVRAFLWRCRDRNFRAIKRGRQPKKIKHPVPISVPIQRTASGKPVPAQAATRIQAAFRGSMARRRTREEIMHTASTQVQRVFRGFRVRKRVHLGDFAGLLSLCTLPRTGKAAPALSVDTAAKPKPEVVAPPLSPTGLYATAPAANKKVTSPVTAAAKPAEEKKVPKTAVATPLVAAAAVAVKQEVAPKAAAPAAAAPQAEPKADKSAAAPTSAGSGGSSSSVGGAGSEKKEKAPVDQDAAMTPDPKFLYRALYDFEGKNHLQLSFKKGDVLEIMSDRKSGWWQAKKGTKTGAIPFNYVRKLDKLSPAGGGTVA